jgi:hypothetical protein
VRVDPTRAIAYIQRRDILSTDKYYEPYLEIEEDTSTLRRSIEGDYKGNKRCPCGIRSSGEGHLRRVPGLVRPRGEWAEEGIGHLEELA